MSLFPRPLGVLHTCGFKFYSKFRINLSTYFFKNHYFCIKMFAHKLTDKYVHTVSEKDTLCMFLICMILCMWKTLKDVLACVCVCVCFIAHCWYLCHCYKCQCNEAWYEAAWQYRKPHPLHIYIQYPPQSLSAHTKTRALHETTAEILHSSFSLL